MKVVAIVPIKLNNSRLPGKNIKAFDNGEPLCTYILNTLKQVKGIEEVYVYCSNPKIKDYLPAGITYLPRSESLDQDTTKINEVLKAFAEEVKADVYVMSHVTAPFLKAESIENGLNAVLNDGYDSALSVKNIASFVWKDGKPFNYQLDNIPRTQDLPPLYEETSGFYIFKSEVLEKYNRRIGNNPYLQEITEIESIDIDNGEDFDIANAVYNWILK